MNLGIFVEGPSDKQVIPVLIRKLVNKPSIAVRVVPQSDMLDVSAMESQIRALTSAKRGLDRILVFIDSEGVDPPKTSRKARAVSDALRQRLRRPSIHYIVVDHSIEGWLACDVDALRAVLGSQARIRITGNPENHSRPAQLLERVFRANGRDFRKTVDNLKIAENVAPENIKKKSPTFRKLVAILGGAAT